MEKKYFVRGYGNAKYDTVHFSEEKAKRRAKVVSRWSDIFYVEILTIEDGEIVSTEVVKNDRA